MKENYKLKLKQMNNLKELTRFYWAQVKLYPFLHKELSELVELAMSEIDEGGSENNECNLAYRDMVEIIEEHQNK